MGIHVVDCVRENMSVAGAARDMVLTAGGSSYVLRVDESGRLYHLYWGKKLENPDGDVLFWGVQRCGFSPVHVESSGLSLDTLPMEYPTYGNTDLRSPAFLVQSENGARITDLRYVSHRVVDGKPPLPGLPATYMESECEGQTLEIVMEDTLLHLSVTLSYSVFERENVLARSVFFRNDGTESLRLLRVLSASVDFSDTEYDMVHLSGAWARERHVVRSALRSGVQSVESRRGASSHGQNPFVALARKDTVEERGEVYGFSLVYSGNFLAQAEVSEYGTTRVSIGVNPFDFSWVLAPAECFQTPEAVLVYSDEGLGGMSRTYHRLYSGRLCRGRFRDQARPILINNWEGTYFDFDEKKILDIARAGKELGVELFVLDDGWFGKRNNDDCSLGDWVENKEKLPEGLEGLSRKINALGMEFGLWFEPEMVSPDSDLYRAHPDWCIHVPDRHRSQSRNQLILDLSRQDVCDYIIDAVSSVLRRANITYVKWDMNRNMSEMGSALLPPERQEELAHRYMLGLYHVLEKITSAFPHVLFESCSGGGGRFDPGMLFYMPQTWTSDDSDAIERLKIQHGTSYVYPVSSMGAHVSAVPNHQVGRVTPLATRGTVAMFGNFGYELDLSLLSETEKEEIRVQIALYKRLREFVQFGDFYRLLSPFEGDQTAWQSVSRDGSKSFVAHITTLCEPNSSLQRLRLAGLEPDSLYQVEEDDGSVYSLRGDQLMFSGLRVTQARGDFESKWWCLQVVGSVAAHRLHNAL